MTYLDTEAPNFTIVRRGYDRAQVDDYIDQLEHRIAAAAERAAAAGTETIFDVHAAIGPRVAEIFALAEAEAQDLREHAARRSEELLSSARAESEAIVEAAEKGAATTRDRAEREHVVLFAELEQERERIRAEVTMLERRKAEAIGELHRLRELLGEVAGETTVAGSGISGSKTISSDETCGAERTATPARGVVEAPGRSTGEAGEAADTGEPLTTGEGVEPDGRASLAQAPIGSSDETMELPALTVDLDDL